MIIRDAYATFNGDKTTFDLPSDGLDIVADDGRTMFRIVLEDVAVISVWSGDYCRHKGKLFEDRFVIEPHAANVVHFIKLEHAKI